MIRVVIVAESRLFREGLALALEHQGRLHVSRSEATVEDALQALPVLQPDAVLLDMAIPDALGAVRRIVDGHPPSRVVALGVADTERDVIACAEAGAAGYVFRDASVEAVTAATHSAVHGELHCSAKVAGSLLRRVAHLAAAREGDERMALTRREHEVLQLVDDGLSNKEIAVRLTIEVATVKNHVHNILEKLGVRRRGEAAARLRRQQRHRRSSGATPLPYGPRASGRAEAYDRGQGGVS